MADNNINCAREAFLLALFHREDMYHSTYLAEKIAFAFNCSEEWMLRQALDSGNQRVFNEILDRGND